METSTEPGGSGLDTLGKGNLFIPKQQRLKNSFYFDHDYNARNDQKILEVRAEFGWEGYAIFFALLECLCESGGYLKREALAGLSLGLNLPKEKLIGLLDFFIKVDLFSETESGIFSERIINHLAYRQRLSEAGAKGGRGNKKETKPGFSHPKATPKAVKESKERNNIYIPPTFEEFKNYFLSNGYPVELAERAYRGYEAADWHDSQGKKIKNWKQKLHHVWFKLENKAKTVVLTATKPRPNPIADQLKEYSNG
jgi:hypothetical protein